MTPFKRNDGFTLVELLVAVAITVLVMGLAVPKIQAAMSTSRQTKVQKDLRTIHDALERYYADQGYYPVKLNQLVDDGYLRQGTSFRSPISGGWYLYAVDDNAGSDPKPHAYILGAPPSGAGPDHQLYHGRVLPKGRRPDWKARAWLNSDSGQYLFLWQPGDANPLPATQRPLNLGNYRDSCQQGSTTPCDLIAN